LVEVFKNFWLLNNYLLIILELLSFIHYFIIIKGITLFYILLLEIKFEIKFQNRFGYFIEFIQILMNFRNSNPSEFDSI
jgi:hypothetical protein